MGVRLRDRERMSNPEGEHGDRKEFGRERVPVSMATTSRFSPSSCVDNTMNTITHTASAHTAVDRLLATSAQPVH